MRYLFIVLLLTAITSYSQIFEPFPKGLFVEAGVNYPMIDWNINPLADGFLSYGDRKEFWLRFNYKVGYSVRIYHNFYVKPFAGYLTFGGRSEEQQFGYKDKILFNSIEAGTFFIYKINDLELGPGVKWNRHLAVKNESYGYFNNSPSPRYWQQEDYDFFFKKYSFDWGIRASYLLIYKVNIFAEYWSSLHKLEKESDPLYVNVKASTIKLGAGFNF